jgi:hypothetical protein
MFGGLPRSFFTLVTSPPLLDELDEKLRAKFGVSKEDAVEIRRKLEGVASIVQPAHRFDVDRR